MWNGFGCWCEGETPHQTIPLGDNVLNAPAKIVSQSTFLQLRLWEHLPSVCMHVGGLVLNVGGSQVLEYLKCACRGVQGGGYLMVEVATHVCNACIQNDGKHTSIRSNSQNASTENDPTFICPCHARNSSPRQATSCPRCEARCVLSSGPFEMQKKKSFRYLFVLSPVI